MTPRFPCPSCRSYASFCDAGVFMDGDRWMSALRCAACRRVEVGQIHSAHALRLVAAGVASLWHGPADVPPDGLPPLDADALIDAHLWLADHHPMEALA